MVANIQIGKGTAPTVSPDTVDSANPMDVWFQYDLTNQGDENGTSVNFYVTIEDMNGTNFYSEFVPDQEIGPGSTVGQGVNIPGQTISAFAAGDYWVSLRENTGNTLGAARLTVSGQTASSVEARNVAVSPDTVSAASPADVSVDFDLSNMTMNDDTATGFYVTVEDAQGTFIHSDSVSDDQLPAGQTTNQRVTISSQVVAGWSPGVCSVNVRNPSGTVLATGSITVTQ